jgi:polyisoprenoid-binding protein YceI
MKRLLALALVATIPGLAAAEVSTWTFDPAHTSSQFSVRHLVISTVRGQFSRTTGALRLDEKDLTKSTVEATVYVNTIDTRVTARDTHLKSPDFFDAAKYPTMTFKSTKVVKAGADTLKVTGDLTLKGTTKPVVFEVSYSPVAIVGMGGELRRGFSATAKINRKDFGLSWSKMVEAGPAVGDEVSIVVDAEVIKAQPEERSKAAAAMKEEMKQEKPSR